MSTDRAMDKDVVHTYNRILLSNQKEWNNVICSNVGEPRYCHNEWSKLDRERHISYDITSMWNLKKKKDGTNEPIYKTEIRVTHVENKLMVTGGKGSRDKSGDLDWHIYTTISKTCN